MTHKSNPVGNEITCIMHGIKDAVLSDSKKMMRVLLEAAKKEKFKILKSVSYAFKPRGFTAILLIQESHIAIHTYPEYNCLVFNLYSCRGPWDGRRALNFFKKAMGPKKVDLRESRVVIGNVRHRG